jgi:predicted nucleotidyltransferase
VKDLTELKGLLHEQAPYLAEKYGVRIIGVFGSYVRAEHQPESDLDILVELDRPPKISLIGLVELEYYLSDLLGVRVDIAIKENLRKRVGERILREVVQV